MKVIVSNKEYEISENYKNFKDCLINIYAENNLNSNNELIFKDRNEEIFENMIIKIIDCDFEIKWLEKHLYDKFNDINTIINYINDVVIDELRYFLLYYIDIKKIINKETKKKYIHNMIEINKLIENCYKQKKYILEIEREIIKNKNPKYVNLFLYYDYDKYIIESYLKNNKYEYKIGQFKVFYMDHESVFDIDKAHIDIIDNYFIYNKIDEEDKEIKKDKKKLYNWIYRMYGCDDICNEINTSTENLEDILKIAKKYDIPEILFLRHIEKGKEALIKHEFLHFKHAKYLVRYLTIYL